MDIEGMQAQLDAMRSDPRKWDVNGTKVGPFACFWGLVEDGDRRAAYTIKPGESIEVAIVQMPGILGPERAHVRRVA